ncbi:2-amino-3-ketobutyrate coenzyme A ligase [Devosia pacifica]|uniref:2-amino-3-ketobutyrate coenzyme A ligase n=1 Tax=Devosia pacifica TaxID=1335967 RepID=A0A918RUC7_9HYPH|nr:glycine C-acetyltransferase [Devosia pacifica]GHA13086.1 2-amino-3-ketobutyrate coenzyme A ligase [Devosia pacifica]
MLGKFEDHAREILAQIEADGLYKRERQITSAQDGRISFKSEHGERQAINLCANNYLGLANHPEIAAAAKAGMDSHGYGMASVRFICGTQDLHRALERRIADYLEKDDAILFAACFDANGAIFETLLEAEDAVISDSLNHASIIDGVRLSKAKRFRYANNDMDELEARLKEADAAGARFKLIVTDGVFSMDGHVAQLPEMADLAERYGAMVVVDDCHATGHLGEGGRGTPTLTGAGSKVDIITGTLGKTLGGAMGGFITGPQAVIDLLRQRARPYLFSNALSPALTAGALKAVDLAEQADDLREKLQRLSKKFRQGLEDAGFTLIPGRTPIIPVMLEEAELAQRMAQELDRRGVFVAGFFYPVVPKGRARIRTQMSAALSETDVDAALDAFVDAGKALKVI